MRNARKRGHILRGTLGIAASHNDFAVGINSADAANGGAGVLFSGRGYCTGIKYYVISPGGARRALQSALPELLLYSCAVSLSRAATEIFYVKAGHAPILAYIQLPLGSA